MFITRKEYEMAIRRAKEEGKREAMQEMRMSQYIEDMRREIYNSFDNLREEINSVRNKVHFKDNNEKVCM